jgi:gamma-glutamyltranspeptidase / glutathione hydrolase
MPPTRPYLVGHFGMAASTHWLATGTAMSVLERGGNAFDAAAAAGFVLQVVEPHRNGPGGEVPMVVWDARAQSAHVVCGQGVAPAAATIPAFRDLGLEVIPGTGLLPATVPGAFGAWILLLQRWGTWTLRDILDYAIGYCRRGYPALPCLVSTLATVADLFRTHWPTSAAAWLPGNALPTAGSMVVNPVLAKTYLRIVTDAERGHATRDAQLAAAAELWYRGFVAEAIGEFCATTRWLDTSGEPHHGLLTAADLAAWQPDVERPASFDYHGYRVLKTGLWGQGPVFLQQLALLAGFDLDGTDLRGPDYLHVVTECAKLAFADREAWYGDSPAVPDTLDHLLDPSYTTARRRLITDTANNDLRPGLLDGREPRLARPPAHPIQRDEPAGTVAPAVPVDPRVRGDTCHVDVIDHLGNMISATPSGGWLQSSPTLPALGFSLGTRAQMFWLDEGLPNSLRPGARPRTTLSPTLALREGYPWLAFGTPGGDQQDQWSLHFFLAVIHGKLNLQEAIDAPAFHTEHFPSSFFPRAARPGHLSVENRFSAATLNELRRRGHHVDVCGPWTLSRLSAVAKEPRYLAAAADPRGGQGYAAGR